MEVFYAYHRVCIVSTIPAHQTNRKLSPPYLTNIAYVFHYENFSHPPSNQLTSFPAELWHQQHTGNRVNSWMPVSGRRFSSLWMVPNFTLHSPRRIFFEIVFTILTIMASNVGTFILNIPSIKSQFSTCFITLKPLKKSFQECEQARVLPTFQLVF